MSKVQAYVYDITQGMAPMLSQALLGKQVELVPHTGIVVFGKEYFFGSGPCIGEPGKSVPVPVAKVIDLGETDKTCEELEAHIQMVLGLEHTAENYSLMNHNCNHYADDVAKFLLGGQGLPAWIPNFAQETLNTPQGQMLKAQLEMMDQQMRTSSGAASGGALNPFGNVGSAGPAAAPSPAVATATPSAPAAAPAAASPGGVDEDLEAALMSLSAQPVDVRRAAMTTLVKITTNVVKNPAEPKFRRIKTENPAFKKKIIDVEGGMEVLIAAGWTPDEFEGEAVWMMEDAAMGAQGRNVARFQAELDKLPGAAPAPPPAAPAPPPSASNFGGLMGGLGGGMPGGGLPGGGLPGGISPQMMQQAQQMMQSNPQMMAQAQQMMQDPQMMAQVQQMMQNPQAMAQMQQMMGGGGMGGFGGF